MNSIIVLTGPTASGKTHLAIKLAQKLNAEIICADSRIIYKDLDIVSAKPTKDEQKLAVHHLIDIIDPDTSFSAGDFVRRAKPIIDNTKKNIIIAGGTWFYIKSLLDDKELIECPCNFELRKELEKLDNQTLFERLKSLDEKRAFEIHPNNKDKIIRSIEMCTYLNAPVSKVKRKENKTYKAHWFMPYFERDELYERINKRVDEMIYLGLYEEWLKNKEKYPNSSVILNTIGYKEFFEYDYDLAVEKIKQHTRNFAKRQMTFFRSKNNIKPIKTIDDVFAAL